MEPSLIAGDLWAYRAELAAQLQELDAKLQQVNAALRALNAGQNRTFDLLRACVADEREVDARTAFDYLTARGWQAEARSNPLNAVRSALAHLARCGDIQRVSRGVYRVSEMAQEQAQRDQMADAG